MEAYRETDIFDLDLSKYSDLMTDMAYDGKWEPLVEFITSRMRDNMSLRDLITGEKYKKNIGKTTLVKLALIFCGHELMYKGDVNQ
ncbi:MAG: hypothetical protein JSV88_24415 [Candidatus Aminicenantes bacterium]|nr:MAG: hypothetical protein JSV88_24415 [Candidatus Aminicenantes bacterium]